MIFPVAVQIFNRHLDVSATWHDHSSRRAAREGKEDMKAWRGAEPPRQRRVISRRPAASCACRLWQMSRLLSLGCQQAQDYRDLGGRRSLIDREGGGPLKLVLLRRTHWLINDLLALEEGKIFLFDYEIRCNRISPSVCCCDDDSGETDSRLLPFTYTSRGGHHSTHRQWSGLYTCLGIHLSHQCRTSGIFLMLGTLFRWSSPCFFRGHQASIKILGRLHELCYLLVHCVWQEENIYNTLILILPLAPFFRWAPSC